MTHASNVTGTILPIQDCFKIAKKYNLITILDSAQTAGYLPIDMQNDAIDVLAFTGHKNMLALSGIGGFIIQNKEVARQIKPVLSGGTGSFSQEKYQPNTLPDKFEMGTQNIVGIISLYGAMLYLEELDYIALHNAMREKQAFFMDGLQKLPVLIYGTQSVFQSVPVISIGVEKKGLDVSEISNKLLHDFDILTRSGLHCAPLAHKTIGSYPQGTLRFSFGSNLTLQDLQTILDALAEILR